MNIEKQAHLQLLNVIEPGSEFWCNEVKERGAIEVLASIKDGFYLTKKQIEKIVSRLATFEIEKVVEEISKCGAKFIYPGDKEWPTSLNDLRIPPFGLIMKGEFEFLSALQNSIAIVGTRNPTPYGARISSEFAAALADREWSIVSGGAIGIDAAAHQGALAAEGITFGVLAGGVNQPYPLSNVRLFNGIQDRGLLISEVMPHVHPVPHRFLIRNRLIAALTKGTIVVEAAYRSGSLRTAREAAEIFRPVMAVPGPINVPTSEGCHRLISDRCAEIVTSIKDILDLVNPLTA